MGTNRAAPVDLEGFRASMRAAGIEEIVEPTLQVYSTEARVTFDTLRGAVARGDIEAARAAAHSLKSASGSIRASNVASILEELEKAAEDGDAEAVAERFDVLRPEFRRVMDYLDHGGSPGDTDMRVGRGIVR